MSSFANYFEESIVIFDHHSNSKLGWPRAELKTHKLGWAEFYGLGWDGMGQLAPGREL